MAQIETYNLGDPWFESNHVFLVAFSNGFGSRIQGEAHHSVA